MGVQLDAGKKKGGITPVINVTPLVDVVLVLLIIFMVVLPNVQDGKPIEIVKVEEADKNASDKEPVTVTVNAKEIYTLGEEDMSRSKVLAGLAQEYERDPAQRILLRADAGLPYKVVRELFADIQNIGFQGIALAVGVGKEWKEGEG